MYGTFCVISTYRSLDFQSMGFLAGGDSHCLEPLQTSPIFVESVLPGAGVPSLPSLPPSSLVSTNGSVRELVISGVSGGDVWGSFNRGELDALGAPHPLWGAGTLVLTGFLKKK